MARQLCCEEGCTRPAIKRGRCDAHYQRWYKSDAFERKPPPEPIPPPPTFMDCPWCGPVPIMPSGVCPSCDMTPGEHAYRLRILADSDAVYAEEIRAFQAQRQIGGS
jgi:hypothetical protein